MCGLLIAPHTVWNAACTGYRVQHSACLGCCLHRKPCAALCLCGMLPEQDTVCSTLHVWDAAHTGSVLLCYYEPNVANNFTCAMFSLSPFGYYSLYALVVLYSLQHASELLTLVLYMLNVCRVYPFCLLPVHSIHL